MKAMILAAGKGTRLNHLTYEKPKALVSVHDITLLEHTINYLKYYGVKEIIVNVHHFSEQIIDFIRKNNSFGIHIEISDETIQLLGTGGGLKKASWFFENKKPFFLTGVDVFTDVDLLNMYQFHINHNSFTTLAAKDRPSSRNFLIDADTIVCGWKNNITGEIKKARTPRGKLIPIAFSVIHILNPVIFNYMDEEGEFSMTDLYLKLAPSFPIKCFVCNDSKWFECGRVENYDSINTSKEVLEIINKYRKPC